MVGSGRGSGSSGSGTRRGFARDARSSDRGRSLQLRVGNATVKTFGIVRVSGAGGFGVPHTGGLDYANTFSITEFTY